MRAYPRLRVESRQLDRTRSPWRTSGQPTLTEGPPTLRAVLWFGAEARVSRFGATKAIATMLPDVDRSVGRTRPGLCSRLPTAAAARGRLSEISLCNESVLWSAECRIRRQDILHTASALRIRMPIRPRQDNHGSLRSNMATMHQHAHMRTDLWRVRRNPLCSDSTGLPRSIPCTHTTPGLRAHTVQTPAQCARKTTRVSVRLHALASSIKLSGQTFGEPRSWCGFSTTS